MAMLVTTRGSHPHGRAPLSAPPSSPAIKGPSISLNKSIWDIKEFVPRSRMVSEQISVSPRISLLLSGSLDLRIFQDLENEDLRVCPSYPKKLVLTLIMAMWKKTKQARFWVALWAGFRIHLSTKQTNDVMLPCKKNPRILKCGWMGNPRSIDQHKWESQLCMRPCLHHCILESNRKSKN